MREEAILPWFPLVSTVDPYQLMCALYAALPPSSFLPPDALHSETPLTIASVPSAICHSHRSECGDGNAHLSASPRVVRNCSESDGRQAGRSLARLDRKSRRRGRSACGVACAKARPRPPARPLPGGCSQSVGGGSGDGRTRRRTMRKSLRGAYLSKCDARRWRRHTLLP